MESWVSLCAILHFIHIITGAVLGDVRGRPSSVVLTHSPLGPISHLTSAPMVPTHPRIPRTAPDPPGEPVEGWKKKKHSVADVEGSTIGGTEETLFLQEKSSVSVILGKAEKDKGFKNTVKSLKNSRETIETHLPTGAPISYLPQASLPTTRPTEGIQYTPRAEMPSITPGTLSAADNPFVSPLTPWVAATPKTYWTEESTVNPWMQATPVTKKRIGISPKFELTATSVTQSYKSAPISISSQHKNPLTTQHHSLGSSTTTIANHVKGKLSIPSPHVPAKPTRPSVSITLKDKSSYKRIQNTTHGEISKDKEKGVNLNMRDQQSEGIRGQIHFPLDRINEENINPQVARIWGGGDNQQLSALEEDLYRESLSRPWLTGRRMRRKLSVEPKPILDHLSTEPPNPSTLESRKVLSAGETGSIVNNDKPQEVRNVRQNTNASLDNIFQYEIPIKSIPEILKLEKNHKTKSAHTDFKITKTGDYGGFSVTKTEEIDPDDTKDMLENKPNEQILSFIPKGKSLTKDNTINSTIPENAVINGNNNISRKLISYQENNALKSNTSTQNNQSSPKLYPPNPFLTQSSKNNAHTEAVEGSGTENKLSNSSASKPNGNVVHNVSVRQSIERNPDTIERHSSPFIINSKQLREYKGTIDLHKEDSQQNRGHTSFNTRDINESSGSSVDSRRPPRLIKMPLDNEPMAVIPTKIFPVAYKTVNKTITQHSKSHTEATLSSVFKEDLIPPLPNRWGKEWHVQNQMNIPGYKSGQNIEVHRGSSWHGDVLKSSNNQSLVKTNVSKSNIEAKATQPTKTNGLDLENSMAVTIPGIANDEVSKKPSVEVRESLGKADLRGPPWPGAGERVEFVTVVPGGQWDVWGGPQFRDPLAPRNNSFRNPQVYSVYWGDTGGPGSPSGWPEGVWVIRGGSLSAIIALVVTISVQVARDGPAHRGTATADSVHRAQHNQHATLATNLATSLASAHVLLIFGIQATGKAWVCGVVGLLLHFLHLVSCCWLLGLTVRLLVALHNRRPIHTAIYCTASWGASLGLVVVSYLVNPDGYETRRYCWMSIERGMLVSFIVPVCTLILVNAGVCLAAQKVILDRREGVKLDTMSQHKRDLRGAVSLLPLEGISWFLAVVALEDHQSLALDCAAALVSACLGWLVLYFHGWTWRCHGLCWLRRQLASSRRVDDLSMPLTARYDHDLAHQPLIPTQMPNPPLPTQPHTTVTLAPPPAVTPTSVVPTPSEEFPLQPIFPLHERRDAY